MSRDLERAVQDGWSAYLEAAERDWERLLSWPIDDFPHVTEDGRWQRMPITRHSRWLDGDVYDHGNWTAGFALGNAALLHASGRAAEGAVPVARFHERLARLAPRADDLGTHDLGFLFFPGHVLGVALGLVDGDHAEPALHAARTIARRFNGWGGYIQAFGLIGEERSAGTSTIDTMMNLPLLWWAARSFAEPQLFAVARRHALTSARVFLREDDSTYHLVRFDPLSGGLLWRGTFQGAGGDSCWSRGQAWGVCGFAWAFAATGEPELLEAAERCARYFWRHLPEDGVPPWDFADRSPDATRDASAGAIAALGALLLAEVHPDAGVRHEYRGRALALLAQLSETCVNRDPDVDGVLLHSCYSKPHGLGVDGAMGWGDFYTGLALALAVGALSPGALGCGPPADRMTTWRETQR